MNNIELKSRVFTVANHLIEEKNYISPVDVLMGISVLLVKDYENWRFGRIPYLEKVCSINLSKMSFVMKEIRIYAQQNQLKLSWTAYHKWGSKGQKINLRFSKSGNSKIEEAYATHYVKTSYTK